ncbi:hypothetical protein HDE_13933 [Halotydeus destructor]|nr:hypothetical protein HDE_13933 [Halotydeus destructor]
MQLLPTTVMTESKPIFCVFCPVRFGSNEKNQAVQHYWAHISQPTNSSNRKTIKDENVHEREHLIQWIHDFVNSLLQSNRIKDRDNWKNCPVCERMWPNEKKFQRKPSVLKEHIRSHLAYKQYLCNICSDNMKVHSDKALMVMDKDFVQRDVVYSVDLVKGFKNYASYKTSKKAVLKHVREDHLTEVPTCSISSSKCHFVSLDELIQGRKIEALDILLEQCQPERHHKDGSSQEVYVSDNNEILTITTQPLQGLNLMSSENSLLASKCLYNTKDLLPKRKRRKYQLDDLIRERNLETESERSLSTPSLITEKDEQSCRAFYGTTVSSDHNYCVLPERLVTNRSEVCETKSRLSPDCRDSGYSSDASDDSCNELMELAFELIQAHNEKQLEDMLSGADDDALAFLELSIYSSFEKHLAELSADSVIETFKALNCCSSY